MGKRTRARLAPVTLVGVIAALIGVFAWRGRSKAAAQMPEGKPNRLAKSASPYLHSAAHQPIDWYEWGPEPFERARLEDKPILLDIGAVWCHWCHVMDAETYENPEVAKTLNENFICIKVDRDERPDVDHRYQEAVAAMGAGGGWPLTAFLTLEGKLFLGLTYLPAEDKDGRVGMKTVLNRIYEIYRTRKQDYLAQADRVHEHVARLMTMTPLPGILGPRVALSNWRQIVARYDPERGGWGAGPKFPNGAAIEWALWRGFYEDDEEARDIALKTLREMGKGGIHDQLSGGFHRYSVDGQWNVPHFEKMSYVNAEMLPPYLHAYQLTSSVFFKEVAQGIIAYIVREGSDQQNGGFYATQDADIGKGDDGDYYTWLPHEITRVLTPNEAKVALLYYGVDAGAARMEESGRSVLRVTMTLEEGARELKMSRLRFKDLLDSAKQKLLAERAKRKAPFVDRTLYVNWNAMLIAAHCEAYKVLGDEQLKRFALKTTDLLLEKARHADGGMYHILADGTPRVHPLLDDQAQMANALLECYQVSGQRKYLEAARQLLEYARTRFWDKGAGGFFDIEPKPDAPAILQKPRKPIEDSPTPSANAVAALALDKLYLLTGERKYHDWATETLRAFAGAGSELGTFGAAYALAVAHHLKHPPRAVVVGKLDDSRTQVLWKTALRVYRPGKLTAVYDPADKPPHPPDATGVPIAYVCSESDCGPPTKSDGGLVALLKTFGRPNAEPSANKTKASPAQKPTSAPLKGGAKKKR